MGTADGYVLLEYVLSPKIPHQYKIDNMPTANSCESFDDLEYIYYYGILLWVFESILSS